MTDRMQNDISYEVVRSNRRTTSVHVDRDGRVTVRTPLLMPGYMIERFVLEKQDWIRRAQEKQLRQRNQTPVFQAGGVMPYLGGVLRVATASVRQPECANGVLTLPQSGEIKSHALRWLKAQAKAFLPQRTAYWAQVMGIQPAGITIAYPKTRWGSMSSKGAMRLNAALMHCKPELIDYVIVHELSHRVHLNHSSAFHAHVQRYLPDAKTRRAELMQLNGYLSLLRQE